MVVSEFIALAKLRGHSLLIYPSLLFARMDINNVHSIERGDLN